jgi:predicted metal-dependent peptidase
MTTETTSAAAEKIERCSVQMLMHFPWWASLYLNLTRIETMSVLTMAVDGTHLFYNPAFTVSLSDKHCMGVLLHETGHIALLHVYRRKYREPKRWNIACDKAVNAILKASNIELPADCVPPGPLGSLAEEMYDQITAEEMNRYFDPDVLEPGSMSGIPGTTDKQISDKDWRNIIAGTHGNMPDAIKRTIQEATEPRKDWKEELAKFVHATCKSDSHTWTRLSRRAANMPGWSREIESNIVIVLDTSGSVTGPLLGMFAAECRAITALNGITAHILSADAAVHQVIQPGEPFPTTWEGGGGTNFIPALKAAEEYEPNCVIYLTDGDGTYPNSSQYPVLWALTHPHEVPFGEKIILEGINAESTQS